MSTYGAGAVRVSVLTGGELIKVDTGGAMLAEVTAQQIADLAARESNVETITSITTVGAGTLTAAGIVGGIISRGGAQSATAFTDTTATAAAILALLPADAPVNTSFMVLLENTTDGAQTIAGGTGVTISGNSVIPPLTWAQYLLVKTAAAALSLTFVAGGAMSPLPPAVFNTTALESTTLQVGTLCGAQVVNLINTGTTPANLNFPTAAALIAAIPNARVGMSYMLNFRNGSGSANTATITTNTGVTLTGTMTIAQNVTRTFVVTVTAAATVTVQSMGISAAGA